MFLNPTLTLRSAGASVRPEAVYFRHGGGGVSCPISLPLAEALTRVSRGCSPNDVFSEEVLSWLVAREILVPQPPQPMPVFRPGLPSPGNLQRPDQVACNPRCSWALTTSGCVLQRGTDWGGIEEALWFSPGQHQRWLRWCSSSPPSDWTEDDQSLLAAEALVAGADIPAPRQSRAQLLAWREQYGARRHVILEGLISPLEQAALADYTSTVLARGYLDGDYGTYGRQRSSVYDDVELRPLHSRIAPLVSAIAERPLIPSYSFLAFYHGGGGLPRHRDKRHCRASISLSISCPAEIAEQWPLLVYAEQKETQLYWQQGQALFFEGQSLEHRRPTLPAGQGATYLVLHFQDDPESS